MAFLDEEQEQIAPEAPEPPRRRLGGPERRRQQYLVRRLIAVGVGLAFLVLIVVGIRGCLEARSDRGLSNYAQDVSTVMQESEQRGKDFFDTLEEPGSLTAQDLETQIHGLRSANESLYKRAQDIDTPDQMKDAQSAVELSLRLRRDAMQVIGERIGPALGTAETADHRAAIQKEMGALYSSDVLWTQVASPEITEVLDEENLDAASLPVGNYMPETQPEEWLTLEKVNEALAGFGGEEITSGTHGMALIQTAVGGTTLSADGVTTVASDAREVEVDVENQGDSDETGLVVTITINDETVTEEVPSIEAGETATVKAALTNLPVAGAETEMTVVVEPVPGEVDSSNNQASYTVVFGSA